MQKKRGNLATWAQRVTIAYMLLALTGCGDERVRIVLPPAELTTCAAEPAAPSLPEQSPETQRARDEMVLDYILALRSAWGDCAAKVLGLKAWSETVGK